MSETRVVHVNDKVPGAVYIGRANGRKRLPASPFANPYRLVAGSAADRAAVVQLYRDGLLDYRRHLLRSLPDLRGKSLACWCRHDGEARTPDNVCHGDVLVELLESHTDDELRAMGDAA